MLSKELPELPIFFGESFFISGDRAEVFFQAQHFLLKSFDI